MIRLIGAVLLFWEPLHFAGEALGLLTTIAYRGPLAVLELVVHGIVAALSAAAGLALFNNVPDARRIGAAAVVAVAARSIQSIYFSVLPDNTPPGSEPLFVGLVMFLAVPALIVIRRR